jgi:hypothetical protein
LPDLLAQIHPTMPKAAAEWATTKPVGAKQTWATSEVGWLRAPGTAASPTPWAFGLDGKKFINNYKRDTVPNGFERAAPPPGPAQADRQQAGYDNYAGVSSYHGDTSSGFERGNEEAFKGHSE